MLAGALELFLVSLGLTYYIATVGAGLRVLRRSRRARRELAAGPGGAGRYAGRRRAPDGGAPGATGPGHPTQGGAAPGPASVAAARWGRHWGRIRSRMDTAEEPPTRAGVLVAPEDCVVYFIVPCMNEELVIADTVRSLLADSRALVVVVDDASDDGTGELAAAADPDRVMVIRRELPQARLGKGPALNVGFAKVLQDAGVRGIAASRITVCVMDADGRLSDGAVDAVLPLLADQRVGGVQLPVRIRNRTSLLTVMQDLEFWGVCAVAQLGRMASGTVSLGGNGQFTRLAALLEMGPAPWQAQLTEDLDLSLALAAKGWRLTSCADAYVSQQGVSSLRALINQRTRWYQGHMQAVRWLRELWSSRQLSHLGMLELTIYLLVPWALVLPWSIIFNYNLLIMVLWILGWVSTPGLGADLTQKIATLVFWYALSCLPVYMAGFLYGRQERKVGYLRAFFIGHLLLVGNYVTYAACWRAIYRLITGAHGWEKTRRTDERRISERRTSERTAARPRTAPAAPVPALEPAAPGWARRRAIALSPAAVPPAGLPLSAPASPADLSPAALPPVAGDPLATAVQDTTGVSLAGTVPPGGALPAAAAGQPSDARPVRLRPAADVLVPEPRWSATDPAGAIDLTGAAGTPVVREPVLAAAGSHGQSPAPVSARLGPGAAGGRGGRPGPGSHRAARSRSGRRSGRPAR